LLEGGRTVFGVKTAIHRLVPGESTNRFPKRKTAIRRLCGELNIPDTDKLFEETAICRSLWVFDRQTVFSWEKTAICQLLGEQTVFYWERPPFVDPVVRKWANCLLLKETAICWLLGKQTVFYWERLPFVDPFADSAGDYELSSGWRLSFIDSAGESFVDLLGDSWLFSLTKKWHLSTLLGKYQTFCRREKKRPLVNYVEEFTLLEEENGSSTLWEMRNRLSYPNKIVECRSVGESRLRNSKSEQTISLRETTICCLA